MQTSRRQWLHAIKRLKVGSEAIGTIGTKVQLMETMGNYPSCSSAFYVSSCSFKTSAHKEADGLGGVSSGPAEIFDR